MAKTIRISPNEEMITALDYLKAKRFPFLKDDEIVKLALSRLYREEREDFELLSSAPGGIPFSGEGDITEWWMKNKKSLRS